MAVERTDELPAPELAASVGVDHTAGDHATAGDSIVERGDGEATE